MKIDRKCPFYCGSLDAAYYGNEKNRYIESQVVNVDCILFMEQANVLSITDMERFAQTVIGEYGVRRPLSLLSDYLVSNTTDQKLIHEALRYLGADNVLQVRMQIEFQKVLALFQNVLLEGKNELEQYRLFDKRDCDPLEGEKSLGRILVMSVDGIPPELRIQDYQLVLITPEVLERPLYKVTCISGGGCSSAEDLSPRIIGVLKEELVPAHVRNILAGKPVEPVVAPDRLPLEIDRKASLYTGDIPSLGNTQTIEAYMASTAANIDCIMRMMDVPKNESGPIREFAEQLAEEYGVERPQYLLGQYFEAYHVLNGFGNDRILHNTDLILPNLDYYPDGRMKALRHALEEISDELSTQQGVGGIQL